MPKRVAITPGQVFGRLTVLTLVSKPGAHTRMWACRCECGASTNVATSNLSNGNTRSCGCFRDQVTAVRSRTHGLTRTPIYDTWAKIVGRCYDEANNSYADYGGRGITVCEAWRHDPAQFARDMGPRPTRFHSIDRINNDGPYAPDNCRWATKVTQSNNTRANVRITYEGETLTLAEWARRAGLSRLALARRLEHGWPMSEALSAAQRGSGQPIEYRHRGSDRAREAATNAALARWHPHR